MAGSHQDSNVYKTSYGRHMVKCTLSNSGHNLHTAADTILPVISSFAMSHNLHYCSFMKHMSHLREHQTLQHTNILLYHPTRIALMGKELY